MFVHPINDLPLVRVAAEPSSYNDSLAHYHRGAAHVNGNGARLGACSSPPRFLFPSATLLGHPVGQKQGFQLAANPGSHRTLSVDGPGEHGTAIGVLDKAGKFGRITTIKLTCGDRFIEKLPGFVSNDSELRERDGVKIGIS
jgi:hypothetical protein